MAISPGKWEIVKALFESAQDLPAEQVPAFLANKSPDHVVRAEVSRLLAEFREAGTFLSAPALTPNAPRAGSQGSSRHGSISSLSGRTPIPIVPSCAELRSRTVGSSNGLADRPSRHQGSLMGSNPTRRNASAAANRVVALRCGT